MSDREISTDAVFYIQLTSGEVVIHDRLEQLAVALPSDANQIFTFQALRLLSTVETARIDSLLVSRDSTLSTFELPPKAAKDYRQAFLAFFLAGERFSRTINGIAQNFR